MSEGVNPNTEYGRLQAEIARLRAEVERLKSELKTYQVNWPDLERERDEAQKEVSRSLDLAETACAARDEALAQVASFTNVSHAKHRKGLSGPCSYCVEEIVHRSRVARALLDRLQRAEAVVEAVRTWSVCPTRIQKAIAAWEEGKA